MGKEPELVLEVEQYQLDIVSCTWVPGLGSGTSFLEKGWTLMDSVASSKKRQAGVGMLTFSKGTPAISTLWP